MIMIMISKQCVLQCLQKETYVCLKERSELFVRRSHPVNKGKRTQLNSEDLIGEFLKHFHT